MSGYNFEVEGRTAVIRSMRAQPPAHYRLEVRSYASLSKALPKDGCIESPEFSAAGNTWTLSIYPQGNSEDNGKCNISLYLKKINKANDSKDAQVTLRFFIYDYIRGQFLIIQDSSVKEYDSGNTECGIARALDLTNFNDAKNGFVKNDRCSFGVEVFAHVAMEAPSSSLIPFKEANGVKQIRSHSWISAKYSDLPEETRSPRFSLCGRSWKIEINPRGYNLAKGKSLSLFLRMDDTTDLVCGNKVFAEFELRLKNLDSKKNITKTKATWFKRNGTVSSGITYMIALNKLMDSSEGYLMNECLSVETTIKTLFLFKS